MRRSLSSVGLIFAALFFVGAVRAADEISGELVGLNVSLAAEKQLVVYEGLIAAGDWGSGLDLIDRLKIEGSDVLVQDSPGRYVGMRVAIQKRLSLLPAEGLDVYRRRNQTVAAGLLNQARRDHDEALLWRIVDEFPAASAAPVAIQDLAAQAVSRGDFELALRLWGRLRETPNEGLPAFPSPMMTHRPVDTEQARHIAMKVALTRKELGVPLSEQELTQIGDTAPESWKLAGRSLGEWLGETAPRTAMVTSPGEFRWSTVATSNCPLPEYQSPLSIVSGRGGQLLVNNGVQVRALHAETGEPFWPSGIPNDVGVVVDALGVIQESSREFPCRIAGGAATRDRYFGVMGDAPRWRPRPGLIPLTGALVALDLAQGQGREIWRVESRELPESDWLFHGPPVLSHGCWPSGDLVVVPICRPAPQVELAVAAFSQDDGHLAWWTRIGTCAADPGEPLVQTQLLSKGGLVVARNLLGVVVAIDARQGSITWASTALVASPPEQHGSPAPLLDCLAGMLVAVDTRESQVVGLSLDSGEQLWRQEISFPPQGIACADQGAVLVAGTRLRAVSLWTGMNLWEFGFDDPAAAGTGLPSVNGTTVLWPTRTRLWGLELRSGAIEFERVHSTAPLAIPMQLMQTNSHWLISLPDAILSLQRDSHRDVP